MSDVSVVINGLSVRVAEGTSLKDACTVAGVETPTLCYLETLTPANACRLCVVEVEGARTLVPSCSRPAEEGMVVSTESERVRDSRRMVLELLATSVDLSNSDEVFLGYLDEYGADPTRFDDVQPATVAQPPKIHDDLFVRDYSRCVLCYKCVEVCGEDAQNSFAIAVAGRGFDTQISTEFDVRLDESACVYCGNCIAVCPTGALLPGTEFDLRKMADWRPEDQTVTHTVCSYCGVGCNLELHVQDNQVVKVTSPMDHDITSGNLCVKGRFGWQYLGSPKVKRKR